MPEEIHSQSQARKRKDRKKKGKDSIGLRHDEDDDPVKSHKGFRDEVDDDESVEDLNDHGDHHHHASGNILSTAVFLILLGGLVVLTALIYIELKDSKSVGPTITDSRYASYLGDFVEESTADDEEEHLQHYDASAEHSDDEESEAAHHEATEVHYDEETEEASIPLETMDPSIPVDMIEDVEQSASKSPEDVVSPSHEDITEDDTENNVIHEEVIAPFVSEELEENEEVPDVGQNHAVEDTLIIDEIPSEAEETFNVVQDHVHEYEETASENEDALTVEELVTEIESFKTEEALDQTEEFVQFETTEVDDKDEHLNNEPEVIITNENELHIDESSSENAPQDTIETAEEPQSQLPPEPESPSELEAPSEPETSTKSESSSESEMSSKSESSTEPESPLELEESATEYDDQIRQELEDAQEQMEKSLESSLHLYEGILARYPLSPRATYGRAQCHDKLSEQKKSNALLDQCIRGYYQLLQMPNIPDSLYRAAAERCADRMKFRGYLSKAAEVELSVLKKFPDDIATQRQLSVTYLQMGHNLEAKNVLEEILKVLPNDGFAKVHYGFILKISENRNQDAIKYLSEGIATGEEGTVDGRFFFHLGDALSREQRISEAYKVYEDGVSKGLFRSVYQRSLYNEDSLTGRPWWTAEQTTYQHHLQLLESNWEKIRQEALALMDENKTGFIPESEGLRDTGVWKQFELFARGKKIPKNCERAPFTCQLVEDIKSAAGCTRGQIKFSLMHPGTHIWAHTGPTNCRIRAHLGLVVPEGTRIRVANETRTWIPGKFIIFDDSFEHEVFHEGTSIRLVLIVDFWHPELSELQRRSLTPI